MKFSELPTTTSGNRKLTVENGVIESTRLTTADHGLLSGWLFLKFGSGGCGFGGYALGKAEGGNLSGKERDYAAEFVVRCLNAAGVSDWENLEGKPLRVLHEGLGGGIVAIGHFLKDEWFCPRIEWEKK